MNFASVGVGILLASAAALVALNVFVLIPRLISRSGEARLHSSFVYVVPQLLVWGAAVLAYAQGVAWVSGWLFWAVALADPSVWRIVLHPVIRLLPKRAINERAAT